MTQILTPIGPQGVFQIADRLTSLRGSPFDAEANKTVVFRARDALAVVSYAGPSFINRVPTDHWIAHVLQAKDPRRIVGVDCGYVTGAALEKWLTIGECLQRLETELQSTRLTGLIELCVAGVQWRRRRGWPHPFAIVLHGTHRNIMRKWFARRHWMWPRRVAGQGSRQQCQEAVS